MALNEVNWIEFVVTDCGNALYEMSNQLIFGYLVWHEMVGECFLFVHSVGSNYSRRHHYSIMNLITHLYIGQNGLVDFPTLNVARNSMVFAYDLYHLNLSDFDFFLVVAK